MTDKQIIIDGVDVSGCLFYQTNFEEDYDVKIKHYCSNWHNSCESNNNSNCYYKQLARKTQECEELKNKNKELIAQCFDLAYKGKKVEKTSLNYQLAEQLDQLKQTLVEINEIAEICSFTDSSELLLKRIKLILQKISEVQNENK